MFISVPRHYLHTVDRPLLFKALKQSDVIMPCLTKQQSILSCLLLFKLHKFCSNVGLRKMNYFRKVFWLALTSCVTAVKNHVIRYCEKVYERSGKKFVLVN